MSTDEKITDWIIDANHSTFEFSVRQVVVSTIKGAFSGVSGEIHFDPDNAANSRVHAVVDISTLDTHHAGRDTKILGEGFFEVESFRRHPSQARACGNWTVTSLR